MPRVEIDGAYDFVSRYFALAKGVAEDPVTGGAHCMLAPYWAKRLGKTMFRAYQASRRGGEVICRLAGERVELQGTCVFYLEGEVEIEEINGLAIVHKRPNRSMEPTPPGLDYELVRGSTYLVQPAAPWARGSSWFRWASKSIAK
jgi:hypothetical protein